MKPIILLACFALAACGGNAASPLPSPKTPAAPSSIVSTAFKVVIPHQTAITPQYLSSTTQQFFFDLQDISGVDYTLTVDATHCTLTPTQDQDCSWAISVPPGAHTVSIAVATSNQGPRLNLPPALLGYAHNVQFNTSDGGVNVVFDAITGGDRGNDTLAFHYNDPFAPGPSDAGTIPWFSAGIYDSGNAFIAWNQFTDGPGAPSQVPIHLLNPLTFGFTGETTGAIALGELNRAADGSVSSAPGTASITVDTLDGVLGFRLFDQLTGTQTSNFQVGLSNAAVTVFAAEFPQISTFPVPGGTVQTSWSATSFTETISVQCVAPSTGVQPCTQVNT
jgi:hypothetical protein